MQEVNLDVSIDPMFYLDANVTIKCYCSAGDTGYLIIHCNVLQAKYRIPIGIE